MSTVTTYKRSGKMILPIPSGLKLKHGHSVIFALDHDSIILMTIHQYQAEHKHLKHSRTKITNQFTVNNHPASRTKWIKSGKVVNLS